MRTEESDGPSGARSTDAELERCPSVVVPDLRGVHTVATRDLVTAQEVVDGATGRAASVHGGGLPRPAEPAAFGMGLEIEPADQLFDGHRPMMPSASEIEVLDGARPTWQHLVVAGHQEHRPGSVDPFVRDLPKAELHVHLEGTLEPEMLFELGERNGISLPYADLDAVRRAYVFDNLRSFLDVYYAGCAVLIKEEDFFELTVAYLVRAAGQGVHHAEVFFDPQTHTGRGIDIGTVVTGIHRALEHGQERLGISWRMIPCFLRHLDAGAAMDTLSQILPYRRWIDVVGLDSSEMGNPPSKFAQVFDRARSEGLLCVAHAGEEGPPEYIWEALDLLRVRRVDHGVRCLDDQVLVERLRAEQIPLTVCPLSNVRLRVFPTMSEHTLPLLLGLGLLVTVNSDDPAYFGGYVANNLVAPGLGLDRPQLAQLARHSFQASFLTEAEKARHIRAVDEFVAGH